MHMFSQNLELPLLSAASKILDPSPIALDGPSSFLGAGTGTALLVLTAIVVFLGLILAMARSQRFRDLSIFDALILAIVLLVLGAATVCFIALLILGFPSFPTPARLTFSQLNSVITVGLNLAAAVGVAVALLVTYRKQRDTEAVREAELFRIAVEQLGSEQYFMRLTGILALRDLADRWESWRQRCIDMLCVALVQPGEGADGINRAICEILRERFDGRRRGWRGYSITIAHGDISNLNLSTLLLHGGSITLRNITLSEPADLSRMHLSGGARLILDGLQVNNTLNLHGLSCQRDTSVEMTDISIGANGVLDLSEAEVSHGGSVRVRSLSAQDGGVFLASHLQVKGLLDLDKFTLNSGASLNLYRVTCNGGSVTIHRVNAPECDTNLNGAAVLNGGYFRVDQYSGHGGRLSLAGGRITAASVVSLTNVIVDDGARLDLRQIYNKGGSLFHAHVVVNAGLVDLAGFENEDEGSVFVLRVHMVGQDGEVQFRGGGNYGGDVHLEVSNTDRSNPAGTLTFERVILRRGQIELALFCRLNIIASDLDVQETDLVIKADPEVVRNLHQGTDLQNVTLTSNSDHHWIHHLDHTPLGRSIR